MSNEQLHDRVMKALSTVMEPELHRDLVTLNMIRDLTVDEAGVAHMRVMLTTPACPLKDVMGRDIQAAATLMAEKQVRRLLVLDRDKNLVGIVSLGDVAIINNDDVMTGQVLEDISGPSQPNL